MIQNVISENQARLVRARQLNLRAGRPVFPVPNRGEMEAWLLARLQGARRVAEIADMPALVLPPLDPAEEAAVLRDNPDTVMLLGEERAVEYQEGRAPRVMLALNPTADPRWLELPEKLTLPGGRAVEMSVTIPGYWGPIAVSADGTTVASKVCEHLNADQWNTWAPPEVQIPDPADWDAVAPFEVVVYGHCVVTGKPLLAYGTIATKYRYYTTDPYFEVRWYRDLAEAHNAADTAADRLCELYDELHAAAVLTEAKASAEAAREELRGYQSKTDWYGLNQELRNKAEARTGYYAYLPSGLEELEAWATETKAILAEVEMVFSELERERAAKAAAEEARRAKLADLLEHHQVRGDMPLAERIDAFVQEAFEIRGARDAARILEDERHAPYGRGRRSDAIQNQFPGINCQGLDWALGHHISPVTFWAEAMLERSKANVKKATTRPEVPKTESKPTTGGLDLSALAGKFTVRK